MSTPLTVTVEVENFLNQANTDLDTAYAGGVSSSNLIVNPMEGYTSLQNSAKAAIRSIGLLLIATMLKNLPQVMQNGFNGKVYLNDVNGNPITLTFDYGVLTNVSN